MIYRNDEEKMHRYATQNMNMLATDENKMIKDC